MLMAVCSFSKAATKEAYAVYNNGTLTFYYDTSKSSQTGDIYALNNVGEDPDWYTYHCNDIKKVVFTKNPNHEMWFGFSFLVGITGIEILENIPVNH